MDQLRLGGAEYAHINRQEDFRLIGADSINLHLKNVEAYKKSAEKRLETKKDILAISKQIRTLANLHFPKELDAYVDYGGADDDPANDG